MAPVPGLDVAETVITTAGNVYLAPIASTPTFPATPGDAPASPFVNIGYIEEGGPSITGVERDVTKRFAWNVDPAIRNSYAPAEPAVEIELLQWNADTFGYFFAPPGTEYAALIDHYDTDAHYRWEFARVTLAANGDMQLVKDDFDRFPIRLDVLSAADEADPWVKLWFPDGSSAAVMNDGSLVNTPAVP